MKPIPKRLLIHTATAITESAPDMWGNKTEASRTELTYVRLEPSSALKLSKQNEQIQLNAVLIYDCCNSRPKNHSFTHSEKIAADGATYNIVSVEKLSDARGVHHIEVGLCL